MSSIELISHHLCPYVQRAVISLLEKGVPFERSCVDLVDRPELVQGHSRWARCHCCAPKAKSSSSRPYCNLAAVRK